MHCAIPITVSVNSQEEGVGPDQGELLDRVLDKGVQVDLADRIAMITGSVIEIHPHIVDEATAPTSCASDMRDSPVGTKVRQS